MLSYKSEFWELFLQIKKKTRSNRNVGLQKDNYTENQNERYDEEGGFRGFGRHKTNRR